MQNLENQGRGHMEHFRAAVKRVTNTLLALGEVGIYSWPTLQVAITSYAEKVNNVTISPFGVLPYPSPGSPETLAISSILFLAGPIWKGYDIGKRWGIFKPHPTPSPL